VLSDYHPQQQAMEHAAADPADDLDGMWNLDVVEWPADMTLGRLDQEHHVLGMHRMPAVIKTTQKVVVYEFIPTCST